MDNPENDFIEEEDIVHIDEEDVDIAFAPLDEEDEDDWIDEHGLNIFDMDDDEWDGIMEIMDMLDADELDEDELDEDDIEEHFNINSDT
jgi:hypothetical protein